MLCYENDAIVKAILILEKHEKQSSELEKVKLILAMPAKFIISEKEKV